MQVGSIHACKASWSLEDIRAEIIDTRDDKGLEYYVHYIAHDRRLDEWIPAVDVSEHDLLVEPLAEPLERRSRKRKGDPKWDSSNELERERQEMTKIRTIDAVYFGGFKIQTWYFSPYPPPYLNLSTLLVCHYCFKYMKEPSSLETHPCCGWRQDSFGPPGKMVYCKDSFEIYQVDGKASKLYCQNLCLFAKLFLDHKTVYFDIQHFFFFVLCQREDSDFTTVGFFSKEKNSIEGFNLSCILVFPHHQRKGHGRQLIEFSYELTKLENKVGTPEGPLSDLGLVGYHSYWQSVLLDILECNPTATLTIRELSLLTSIKQEDVFKTLSGMGMVRYWKGDNIIWYCKLTSVTTEMITGFRATNAVKSKRCIDPLCITYSPQI